MVGGNGSGGGGMELELALEVVCLVASSEVDGVVVPC